MGWIRTVKPELFIHELLYETECKFKLPIRLAFIGLLTQCDSEGRFVWRPRILKLAIMPYDSEIDFTLILDALLESGFVVRYEVDKDSFGYIPTWKKHQRINGKKYQSHIPPPPGVQDLKSTPASMVYQDSVDDNSTTVQCSINDTQTPCQHHINGVPMPERNGNRNGKRNGKEYICEVAEATPPVFSEQDSIVTNIFCYWQSVMSRSKAKLDNKRKKKIEAALKLGYTPEQLKLAIDGCSLTPHNMGTNSQEKKYNDIELIFRDASHIEQYMQNAETNPNVSRTNNVFSGAI